MTLRNATLVAFDGTHASGKTTLIYAVAGLLRSEGTHVGVLTEPARSSPFVDDVVLHQQGDFDLALELDLFAAQITNCVRAARQYSLVLADKTPTNVLPYSRLVLRNEPDSWEERMLDAIEAFSCTWGEAYDAIFFCQDHFRPDQVGDQYRAKVAHLQHAADELLRAEYQRLSQPLVPIPRGLTTDERALWVAAHLKQHDLLSGGEHDH